jgi:CheY-like chemotaxis protein
MADVNFKKLQALIVDDFDSFRMSVVKMLQEIGVQRIDSAVNGAEALRLCRQKAYDLILCDYNLGKGKSGQQVLEELRHYPLPSSDSLFILISAESSKSIIMAAYDYEPDAYLAKPITNKALEQRLVRLFTQRVRLAPIAAAIKEKQFDTAVALCCKEIAAKGRYTNQCQKILGQLYLQLGQYDQAEAVYRDVLEARALDWAQIGMARVKKLQGDLLSAQQWIEEAIDNNPLALRAYDLQADIYREQQSYTQLQQVLEKTVDISPLSILRQQDLGDVALINNDARVAAQAYRRTVKLGEHSCYDRIDNHLGYARAVTALYEADSSQGKPMVREALRVLSETEQRFGKAPEQKIEVGLLECQLLVCNGEEQQAKELLAAVQKLYSEKDCEPPVTAAIELVKALRATGQKQEADAQLQELLARYQEQEAELEKIDALLEEPASTKNRSIVAAINKKGIAYYEAENYADAIQCFEDAQQAFPNHIGIRLNLVQALVDKIKVDPTEADVELAERTLARVEDMLTVNHDQYRRYRQLLDMLRMYQNGRR